MAAIIGQIVTASAEMQLLGGYYVWLVLIVAAAVVIYFSFVFGMLARRCNWANMRAGGNARKV